MPETVRLCSMSDIEPDTARRFDVGSHRIALVRIGADEFFAIGDRCSHADYSLSEGEVYADQHEIECWKHGSTFSLKTGEPTVFPATKAVPTYEVKLDGNNIMVEIS